MNAVSIHREARVAVVHLSSPILRRRLLDELLGVLDELARSDPPPPVVLASEHPTIFLAGAHLGEIAELTVDECVPYARHGRSVARRLETHPSPIVAAVHGSCSGGGVDLVMACDAVVVSPAATFSHPGVRRGLVTGWGGTARLHRPVGSPRLRRMLLEGAPVAAAELLEVGAVHAVSTKPVEEACHAASELAQLDPARFAAWRSLRGPGFIDSFRGVVVEKSR